MDKASQENAPRTALKRVAWFAALWIAGVLALAAVAYLLRAALGL